MTTTTATDLLQAALSISLTMALPVLVVLIALTLFINVLQTLTQLHDHTLAFVPRLVGSVLIILLLLPWLLGRLSEYTVDVYRAAAVVR